ncbi:hypothetical protein HYALB_00010207 [Hymenoscyphus albidus]|uniref:Ribonuclease H n=1 Tax=Hymenoscyphus albidus TaxID=595503 RepID=A0A9N9LJF8_9HELO|nr:hypothetical protein HYALB_00010207 [Hymenoscyphus albidus]
MNKKRKMSTVEKEQKFYAVRAGHTPGVYETWNECQEMITGFKGANYKSFTSKKDAQDFAAGKVVSGMKNSKGDRFYGVAVGHEPGVYVEWADAKKQIEGVKGPKYKKFDTRSEAEEFVRSGGTRSSSSFGSSKGGSFKGEAGERASKKAKIDTGSASVITKGKGGWSTVDKKGVVKVWTDGSSRGNGKVGAVAGVGVWFGEGDERNISEPLAGTPQTNQRAELTAILRALEVSPLTQSLEIISDSNYGINCTTLWYQSWAKNDWKTSTGTPVMNKDLVMKIRAWMDKREGEGASTKLTWVRGHEGDVGNEGADGLAVAGSRMHGV